MDARLRAWLELWKGRRRKGGDGGRGGRDVRDAPDPSTTWGFVRPEAGDGGSGGGDGGGLLGELRRSRIFWCPDGEEAMAAAYGVDLGERLVGTPVEAGLGVQIWGRLSHELNAARAEESLKQGRAQVGQEGVEGGANPDATALRASLVHFNHAVQCDPCRADTYLERAQVEYNLGILTRPSGDACDDEETKDVSSSPKPEKVQLLRRALDDLMMACQLQDELNHDERVTGMLAGIARVTGTKLRNVPAITGREQHPVHRPRRSSPGGWSHAGLQTCEKSLSLNQEAPVKLSGESAERHRDESACLEAAMQPAQDPDADEKPEGPVIAAEGGRNQGKSGSHRKRRRRKRRREH